MLKIKIHSIVRLLTLALVCVVGPNAAMGQESDGIDRLEVFGIVQTYDTREPVTKVKVFLIQDGKEEYLGYTKKRGNFRVWLDYRQTYQLRFEHPQYHTMFLTVNTNGVPDRLLSRYQEFSYDYVPVFPKAAANINANAFKEFPFSVLTFNAETQAFAPDPDATAAFVAGLDAPIAEQPTEPVVAEPVPETGLPPATPADTTAGTETMVSNVEEPTDPSPELEPEPGRVGPVPDPTPPAAVEMETEAMVYETGRQERERQIQENLESKRERERAIEETVVSSTQSGGPSNGRGKYFGATSAPDELKIARYRKSVAEREREAEIARNTATKNERERDMLLALAQSDAQRKRDSLRLAGAASATNVHPTIIEKTVEERFKITDYHYVQFPDHQIVLKRVTYAWGQVYHFRNALEIDQADYDFDLQQYTSRP